MFVHCHQPVNETFAEYANEFSEKISNIAKNYSRVDIVFDEYKHDSLKSFTRKSRGGGRKSKVSPSSKVPKKLERIFEKQPQQNRIIYTSSN